MGSVGVRMERKGEPKTVSEKTSTQAPHRPATRESQEPPSPRVMGTEDPVHKTLGPVLPVQLKLGLSGLE